MKIISHDADLCGSALLFPAPSLFIEPYAGFPVLAKDPAFESTVPAVVQTVLKKNDACLFTTLVVIAMLKISQWKDSLTMSPGSTDMLGVSLQCLDPWSDCTMAAVVLPIVCPEDTVEGVLL